MTESNESVNDIESIASKCGFEIKNRYTNVRSIDSSQAIIDFGYTESCDFNFKSKLSNLLKLLKTKYNSAIYMKCGHRILINGTIKELTDIVTIDNQKFIYKLTIDNHFQIHIFDPNSKIDYYWAESFKSINKNKWNIMYKNNIVSVIYSNSKEQVARELIVTNRKIKKFNGSEF